MITLDKYEQDAMGLINSELIGWRHSTVWVSDDASFNMRSEIDKARKNYFGIFEEPTDSANDFNKLWIPLTEWTVEKMVANIDLDTKDVHLRDPVGKNVKIPVTMKLVLMNFLKKIGFGETLNDALRRLTIDGTVVVKVFKSWNPEYKRNMPTLRIVDTLNIVTDPVTRSLQEAPTIEISVMTKDEMERYKGKWNNIDEVPYTSVKGAVPQTVIFERWGKINLAWITKKEADENKWVEGTIMFAGSTDILKGKSKISGETLVPLLIKKNSKNIKPYEEAWLKRVPGRWAGRGVPEQLKGLQEWLNTVVNIRREEMINKLAGKYKIRKGSGITKQMLEKIRSGGAIPVDEMDDIQELRESDVKASAYREPIDVIEMAEKVTGAKELPSSPTMEPTTAMIQQQDVKSVTNLIQENVGLFLVRLFKRHLIPLTLECLKDGEILRITGEDQDLEIIDEAAINHYLNVEITKFRKSNKNLMPTARQVRKLRQKAEAKYKKMGKDRSFEIKKNVFDTDYDLDVWVTREKFDPAVVLRNLNDFMLSYGKLPQADVKVINAVVQEHLSLLEIPMSRTIDFKKATQPVAPPAEATRQPSGVPTAIGEKTRATTGTISPAER